MSEYLYTVGNKPCKYQHNVCMLVHGYYSYVTHGEVWKLMKYTLLATSCNHVDVESPVFVPTRNPDYDRSIMFSIALTSHH